MGTNQTRIEENTGDEVGQLAVQFANLQEIMGRIPNLPEEQEVVDVQNAPPPPPDKFTRILQKVMEGFSISLETDTVTVLQRQTQLTELFTQVAKEPPKIDKTRMLLFLKSHLEPAAEAHPKLVEYLRSFAFPNEAARNEFFGAGEANPKKQICLEILREDTVAFHCLDCSISPEASFCYDCFFRRDPYKKSFLHEGHRVVKRSVGSVSHYCACGNENLLKTEGFCSAHCGVVETACTVDEATPNPAQAHYLKVWGLPFLLGVNLLEQSLKENDTASHFFGVSKLLIEATFISELRSLSKQLPQRIEFVGKLLMTPIRDLANPKARSLEMFHRHDDYARPQPHLENPEECSCSILQLLLRYNNHLEFLIPILASICVCPSFASSFLTLFTSTLCDFVVVKNQLVEISPLWVVTFDVLTGKLGKIPADAYDKLQELVSAACQNFQKNLLIKNTKKRFLIYLHESIIRGVDQLLSRDLIPQISSEFDEFRGKEPLFEAMFLTSKTPHVYTVIKFTTKTDSHLNSVLKASDESLDAIAAFDSIQPLDISNPGAVNLLSKGVLAKTELRLAKVAEGSENPVLELLDLRFCVELLAVVDNSCSYLCPDWLPVSDWRSFDNLSYYRPAPCEAPTAAHLLSAHMENEGKSFDLKRFFWLNMCRKFALSTGFVREVHNGLWVSRLVLT